MKCEHCGYDIHNERLFAQTRLGDWFAPYYTDDPDPIYKYSPRVDKSKIFKVTKLDHSNLTINDMPVEIFYQNYISVPEQEVI